MKKIIVPIDFTEDSINALEFAIPIANKLEADLTMVYVIKVKRFDFFRGVESVSTKGDFENLVINYADKVKGKLDYKIVKGRVHDEINKIAKDDAATYIVMAAQAMSGLGEILASSDAYRVVAESPCPVITIRKEFQKRDIKKIIMPIDHTFESRQKTPKTMDMAIHSDAVVYVLGTCSDNDKEFEHKVKSYLSQTTEVLTKHNVKYISKYMRSSNVTQTIIDYAKEIDADMIAIMTEQEGSIADMLGGGASQYMVHHSPVPILSVHPREDLVIKTFLK